MKILLLAAAFAATASAARAATFYISPFGGDTSGDGTYNNPWKTLTKAFQMGGGHTFVLKDGAYNYAGVELTSPPSGSAGAYTVIKAENDGKALITRTDALATVNTTQYVRFEGLIWKGSYERSVRGNHLKFLRCGFEGGPASGNVVNTVIGTSDTNDTSHILVEDSWFHGPGGRYNLLVYNSDKVIVRRVVIRHDGGWDDGGSTNPEAGLNFYNSADCLAENVLIIDSEGPYDTWAASFYTVRNNSTSHPTRDNSWLGCIALVGENVAVRVDAASTGNLFQDCVFWDTVNGGISFGTDNNSATIKRLTIGRSKLTATGDFVGGIGGWGSGTKTISDVIITGWSGADLNGVSATFFDTFNNGSTSGGTGRITVNPFTNGLKHLGRVEDGSLLKTAGSSGGQMGAQVVNRYGVSGTLWGESGYNTQTSELLWPWPNEHRIKEEMCASVTRGFCGTDQSLTEYIWEYLGNPNPYPSLPDVDTTSPSPVAAKTPKSTVVDITFSEALDPASAQTAGNYNINNGVTISGVELDKDGKTVHLYTSAHAGGTIYALSISGVQDKATPANAVAPGTSILYSFDPGSTTGSSGANPEEALKPAQKFVSPGASSGNSIAFGADAVEVEIRDGGGNRVWYRVKSGSSPLAWDGRDEGGRPVESGSYLSRITGTSGKQIYHLLVVVK